LTFLIESAFDFDVMTGDPSQGVRYAPRVSWLVAGNM
jgi:hypothetical protein